MGRLALVTPPSIEPVTLAEAKAFAKIDDTAEDTFTTDLIAAARKTIEEKLDRSLITQTWDYYVDAFPPVDCPIRLERPPVISVATVKYTPNGGSTLTMTGTDWFLDATLDTRGRPKRGEVWLNIGKAWPGDLLRIRNGVEVRYTAGFGAAAANVPEHIRTGLKQLVAFWFYNRSTIGTIPDNIGAVLAGAPSAFVYA